MVRIKNEDGVKITITIKKQHKEIIDRIKNVNPWKTQDAIIRECLDIGLPRIEENN